jgi:phospholipid transport system transporter-binding protein
MRIADQVAYPEGPITLDEALAARRDGEAAIADGCRMIDLSGVTQVDSSALSVLLAWRRYALNLGVVVETRNPPASLIGLIDLYGVRELIAS